MARPRLWSAALAWISLAVAGLAHAEPPRSIELPVALPVEVTLAGLEQALATDPSIVRADADIGRGVLTLTGLLLRQETVVYAWTPGGVVVFTVRVVPAPEDPRDVERRARVLGEGAGSLYRVNFGGGFRDSPSGTKRLPFAFGGSGFKPLGASRLTVSGNTRPFGDEMDSQQPTGTALLHWRTDRYHAAFGDQPIDFGPQLLSSVPLRGVLADTRVGPVALTAFGGTRASSEFRLMPSDEEFDGNPKILGGLKGEYAINSEVKVAGAFALTDTSPLGSLSAEWKRGIWTAMVEGAATADRIGATLRVRRETERFTFEQRLTHRSDGDSALLPGLSGFASETALSYRLTPTLAVIARLLAQPPAPGSGWQGGGHIGGDWMPREWLHLAAGVDRTFDGSSTTMSTTGTARSTRLGSVTATVTRTVNETPAGDNASWYVAARAEKPVEWGPVKRVMVEESFTQTAIAGAVSLSAGAEAEVGWLKAAIVPGVVIPTLTDPNGIAPSLRLRLTATPSQALQVQTEVRQTFGKRPDTSVQVGVGVGFGSASTLGSITSFFVRSAVEGVVFVDENGNGRWDQGERGLPGVPVQIEGGATVTTDAEGRYKFSGLREGRYRVGLDRAALPTSLRLASASPVAVRVPDGAGAVEFAFVGTGMIHGMVFNDLRFSRRFSGTEPGVAAEVLVEGPGLQRRVAANGSFSLGGLAPGRYRVALDPLSLPPAYVAEATEFDVEIGAGDSATAQFPVTALRALSIMVCFGRGAGDCDSGARPGAGIRIVAGSTAVITDAKGRALVRQLPAGSLTLTIDPASVPAGWRVPSPITVELPADPATVPVTIRVAPSPR